MDERLGPYLLQELIGRGAMGEVYRALDTVRGRVVAIKILPDEFARDEEFRARFRRESALAARLSEPHIIPIHDYGEIAGRLFIDMRLVQGADLAELISQRDGLEPGQAVDIISQIASALDAAHAEGLLHRDVKPSNVLVTHRGHDDAQSFAYLVDFGIARETVGAGPTPLTGAGRLVGTLAYMAPERFVGGASDHRVDVYALSCVLYECLAGRQPFLVNTLAAAMYAHLEAAAVPPSTINRRVPAGLDAVVARGMAKDPDKRYASTGALAAAARAAMRAQAPTRPPRTTVARPQQPPRPDHPPASATIPAPPPAALPPRRPSISRRRGPSTWIVVSAVAVVALLAGAVLVLLNGGGGGDGPLSGAEPAAVGTVRIGSANFLENVLLAEIYGQALEAKGVTVEILPPIYAREAYFPGLRAGSLDLVPEYTGVLLQFLKPDATETAPDAVYTALQAVVPEGLTVLERSEAENKDAVVITKAFADQNGVRTIADLAPFCPQLVFGGPPEFQTRPDGIPGLQETYGCTFKEYRSLDPGGPLTVAALKGGNVQAADLFTTDPAIMADGFVVLEDPKNNFAAQNVVPLINTAKATDQVRQVLDGISAKLNTQVLLDLNAELGSPDRPNPETVATAWLTQNGLL